MKGPKPAKSGSKMNHPAPQPKSNAALGRNIQDAIGQQLRAMYDDLASENVPDRFTLLLQQLDKQDDEGTS